MASSTADAAAALPKDDKGEKKDKNPPMSAEQEAALQEIVQDLSRLQNLTGFEERKKDKPGSRPPLTRTMTVPNLPQKDQTAFVPVFHTFVIKELRDDGDAEHPVMVGTFIQNVFGLPFSSEDEAASDDKDAPNADRRKTLNKPFDYMVNYNSAASCVDPRREECYYVKGPPTLGVKRHGDSCEHDDAPLADDKPTYIPLTRSTFHVRAPMRLYSAYDHFPFTVFRGLIRVELDSLSNEAVVVPSGGASGGAKARFRPRLLLHNDSRNNVCLQDVRGNTGVERSNFRWLHQDEDEDEPKGKGWWSRLCCRLSGTTKAQGDDEGEEEEDDDDEGDDRSFFKRVVHWFCLLPLMWSVYIGGYRGEAGAEASASRSRTETWIRLRDAKLQKWREQKEKADVVERLRSKLDVLERYAIVSPFPEVMYTYDHDEVFVVPKQEEEEDCGPVDCDWTTSDGCTASNNNINYTQTKKSKRKKSAKPVEGRYCQTFYVTFWLVEEGIPKFIRVIVPIFLVSTLNTLHVLLYRFQKDRDETEVIEESGTYLSTAVALGLTAVFLLPNIAQVRNNKEGLTLNDFYVGLVFLGLALSSFPPSQLGNDLPALIGMAILWSSFVLPCWNFIGYQLLIRRILRDRRRAAKVHTFVKDATQRKWDPNSANPWEDFTYAKRFVTQHLKKKKKKKKKSASATDENEEQAPTRTRSIGSAAEPHESNARSLLTATNVEMESRRPEAPTSNTEEEKKATRYHVRHLHDKVWEISY